MSNYTSKFTGAEIDAKLESTDSIPTLTAGLNSLNDVKADKAAIPDVSGFATKQELTAGLAPKADKTEIPDVSSFATKQEVTQGLAGKQPAGDYATNASLTQGLAGKQPVGDYASKSEIPTVPETLPNPNALTINGTAYDGTEAVNMTIEGGGGGTSNAVLYTAQTLTEAQKTQARANIGAGTGGGGSAEGAVLYTPQALTDEQIATACLNIGAPNTELKSTWKTGAMSTSGVESANETRAISDYMPVALQFTPPVGYSILGTYNYDENKNFLYYESKGSVKTAVSVPQRGSFVRVTLQSSPSKTLTQEDLESIRYNATFTIPSVTVTQEETKTIVRENKPTQSLQLKCSMDATSDSFQPNTCMYLWFDKSTTRFYISYDLKGKKEYAFDWELQDTPDYWSMAFTGYGDILCVYNSAMSDTPRTVNPVVLERTKAYAPTTVFISADKPKPYGWFGNHGFTRDDVVNAVAGEYYIAEYTRTNTDKCIWWHIDGLPTSNSSWKIVKEFELSGSDNNGMKHFHGTQVDPFTGFKYAFTGDDDTASFVLVTKDNGVTNELVFGPDEAKCRLLNYVFTKDHVYWGADTAVEGKRLFFRATRDSNGVIDIANAEVLHDFSGLDTYAVYATVYMEALNCIVILLRSDGVTEMACPIYVWDLSDNSMKTAGSITSTTGNGTGFRCRYYERTPKNNYFAISWDTVSSSNFAFPNPNKVLNNVYNQIYTLILTVNRVGTGFTITYDTVK